MQKVEAEEITQVVVFAFSRIARSTSHLLHALEKFKAKGVRFRSVSEDLDSDSPLGLALFAILGSLSQLERELFRERVLSGIKSAKAKGVRIGRPRQRNDVLIHQLLDASMTNKEIGRIAKISIGTVGASKREWLAKKSPQAAAKIPAQSNVEAPAPALAQNAKLQISK